MRIHEIIGDAESNEFLPPIGIVAVHHEVDGLQRLDEGKWIDGRYDDNIRIDRNSHFASVDQNGVHAHVYGRKDRDNALIAVRLDGTASHGLKGKLHDDDAAALRRNGFQIGSDNIVEYFILPANDGRVILLESV